MITTLYFNNGNFLILRVSEVPQFPRTLKRIPPIHALLDFCCEKIGQKSTELQRHHLCGHIHRDCTDILPLDLGSCLLLQLQLGH